MYNVRNQSLIKYKLFIWIIVQKIEYPIFLELWLFLTCTLSNKFVCPILTYSLWLMAVFAIILYYIRNILKPPLPMHINNNHLFTIFPLILLRFPDNFTKVSNLILNYVEQITLQPSFDDITTQSFNMHSYLYDW